MNCGKETPRSACKQLRFFVSDLHVDDEPGAELLHLFPDGCRINIGRPRHRDPVYYPFCGYPINPVFGSNNPENPVPLGTIPVMAAHSARDNANILHPYIYKSAVELQFKNSLFERCLYDRPCRS